MAEHRCHIVTIFGPAGVGKSRLLKEFLERVGGDATTLKGRCLSYGEGVTYWPIGEVVRAAAGIGSRRRSRSRSGQARRDAPGPRGRDPTRGRGDRPDRGVVLGRGDVLGHQACAGDLGLAAPIGRVGGRHPLGRADAARPPALRGGRVPRAGAAAVLIPPRPARGAPRVGRERRAPQHAHAGTARGGRERPRDAEPARRRRPRRHDRGTRDRRRRREPALPGADAPDADRPGRHPPRGRPVGHDGGALRPGGPADDRGAADVASRSPRLHRSER